jgi:hypothetical protein
MAFSVVFKDEHSIIYKDGKKPKVRNTNDIKYDFYKVSFHIPLPRSEVRGHVQRDPKYFLPEMVMSLRSSHLIFYNVLYCSNGTNKDKKMEIRKILSKDKFYRSNKTCSIFAFFPDMLRCKVNKLYRVQKHKL